MEKFIKEWEIIVRLENREREVVITKKDWTELHWGLRFLSWEKIVTDENWNLISTWEIGKISFTIQSQIIEAA